MTEEPRRSGRATKGVNPKIQEEPPPAPPAPKPKKSRSKAAQADEEGTEEDGEEEVIRCVCGNNAAESKEAFVACDNCSVWQHNVCMGLSVHDDDLPEKYYCEQCRPEDHKELLEGMKRGEQPWLDRQKRRDEEKAAGKGKKGKGSRTSKAKEMDSKSSGKSVSPAQGTPDATVPPAPEKGKRKHAVENGADVDEQPSKLRRSSAAEPKENTRQSKRKSENAVISPEAPALATPTAAPPDPHATVNTIEELQDTNRKGCATFLRAKFEAQIKDLSKRGDYRIPDGETSASLAESLAVSVEHSMFQNHRGPGPKADYGGSYRQQMQSIGSNILQNSTLMLRLLSNSITADQLSKMSSDDMASEELQRQMASMKEEAEKQSTLVSDDLSRPLVRRTHKGEELVDDQSNQMTSDSIVSAPPIRRRESNLDGPESPVLQDARSPDGHKSEVPPASAGKPLTVETSRSPVAASGDYHRRSSSNFDIKNVWSSVQSPDLEQSPRFASNSAQQDPWPAPSQPEVKPKSENDPDIDRLLEEDGTDSPPYSPGEVTGPPIIWRGMVDMPITGGSVARFKAIAQHVAGSDLKNKVNDLSSIYPQTLELSGRIPKDRADDYLSSLSASRSTDVSVHSLRPADSNQGNERAEFEKLFKYFIDRNRYGVVADALHRDNVSDTYIIPLEAGLSKMPSFLERLYYNTIESPPPRPMLLVVFILKWKTGAPPTPAAVNNTESTPSVLSPPGSIPPGTTSVMSPIGRPGSQQPFHRGQQLQGVAPPNPPNSFPPYAPYMAPPPHLQTEAQLKNFENAKLVLADLVNCPTARDILVSQGEVVGMDLWENLKKVFVREPLAKDDLNVFQTVLAAQQQATG